MCCGETTVARMRRQGRAASFAVVAVLAIVPWGRSEPTAAATANRSSVCDLVGPDAVQHALGVSGEFVGGPEPLAGGSCGWHSTSPYCSLRALGVRRRAGGAAIDAFLADKASVGFREDISGLGDDAFFDDTTMPPGAGISVFGLQVRVAGTWTSFSLSGRLLAEPAHDLLLATARAALNTPRPPGA